MFFVLYLVFSVSFAQNLPLPALDYEYNALEPYLDEETMRIHHLKHHQAYTDKLNAALATLRSSEEHKQLAKMGIDAILRNLSAVPLQLRQTIRNNGGGYVNHDLFWKCMSPSPAPLDTKGKLFLAIETKFGSFENFRTLFTQSAMNIFGSGWAWLYVDNEPPLPSSTSPSSSLTPVLVKPSLFISSTPNQDTPTMELKIPILGLDVWEHAYYLKFQNRRADYIENWWKVVNWKYVEALFEKALHSWPSSVPSTRIEL